MSEMHLRDGLDTMRDSISNSKKPVCMYHTDVECRNELGEVLFKKSNTILLGGRRFTLEKLFNLNHSARLTLNSILGIEDSVVDNSENGPKKEKCVCLFGVGDGGSGVTFGSVASPSARETNLYNIVPLQYVTDRDSIVSTNRYFMTKPHSMDQDGNTYYAFYLKAFESIAIKLMVNGQEYTPVNADNAIPNYGDSAVTYNITDDVDAYIELTLKIDTTDVRAYFDSIGEIPKINELALYAGFHESDSTWSEYHEVEAFSKLTFNNVALDSESSELNIIYRIYI